MKHRIQYAAVFMLAACGVNAANAQTPEEIRRLRQLQQQQQQQQQPMREQLNASGIVKGVNGGVLQVLTIEGDTWYVKAQPQRPQDLSFSGEADPSFLQPGMLVRFSSKLTKRGAVDEPLKTIEVVSPRQGIRVGVYSNDTGPSMSGGSSGPKLFETEEEVKPKKVKTPKASKPSAADMADMVYSIVGGISKISRTGELTVEAGGKPIKVELDPEVKVRVSVSDLSHVRVGDKAEIRGWYYAGNKGQAIGSMVTVSTSELLTGLKKKPLTGKKTTDDEDEKSELEPKTKKSPLE